MHARDEAPKPNPVDSEGNGMGNLDPKTKKEGEGKRRGWRRRRIGTKRGYDAFGSALLYCASDADAGLWTPPEATIFILIRLALMGLGPMPPASFLGNSVMPS
ncbi:hypothetical protein RJT34_32602 [Clitoria ternatea]|uniref:Uncharacterized protein n=1 Tax=Clitoria ternatea TaxID=43366 RepID=A0AAN9EWS5_CLITE